MLRTIGFAILRFNEVFFGIAVFFGILSDVGGDLHRAKGGAAHRTKMRSFGTFGWKCFVVEINGSGRVESERELVAPAEFETGLRDGIVTFLRGRVTLGEVCGVGSDFIGDHSFTNIVAIGEA